MKKIIVFIVLFLFLGCGKNEDLEADTSVTTLEDTPFYIENYFALYAQYAGHILMNPNFDNLIRFEYDNNNRIVRRIGDVMSVTGGAGGGGYISDLLFTDLEYFDNKVKLTKRIASSEYMIRPHESIVTLDSENKMVQKIVNYQSNSGTVKSDTINYVYTNNRLTSYVKTYKEVYADGYEARCFEDSYVSYENGNLSTIVTIYSLKYNDMPHRILTGKGTKRFGGYDVAKNPFRKLFMFEETFYRSLSKNNFTTYTNAGAPYIYPDNDYSQSPVLGQEIQQGFQNWALNYDINGEWIYNHP